MKATPSRIVVPGIFILLCTLVVPYRLSAQALPAASKTMEISAFGGYSYGQPDFGPTKDSGGTFGVDVTRYFHLPVSPSLEARVGYISGTTVKELTYMGGLRVQYDHLRRYHPYVNFLGGLGKLEFVNPPIPSNPSYTSDNGLAFSYGAGVNIDIVHHIQAKVDLQSQSWNLGVNGSLVPKGGDFTLSPTILTIGVNYTIPFKFFNRQGQVN